MQYTCPVSL